MTHAKLNAPALAVKRVDPTHPADRTAAADLLLELFGHTPAGVLGRRFLEKFYFNDLISDGLMDCLIYYDGNQPVAISVITTDPNEFIAKGTRLHFFKLAALVSWQLVTRPTRIGALINVIQQRSYRAASGEQTNKKIGEILTFGAIKSHRQKIDPASGEKISTALFLESLRQLRAGGVDYVQTVTYRDNNPINALIKRCGGEANPNDYFYKNTYYSMFDLAKLGY